ncbi:hypothetical protein BGZ99_001223 [Dissophora globulifera]|uniref:N-acetylglucosaminylphosphatidylinositol deacetylase n=1 Tax=Dissophora globulifera TaxID=979702 RepID=A0A9P6RTV1_9FUNG|nr:hypothetical protein BGZ99_001223 [Dissophora globulifera]
MSSLHPSPTIGAANASRAVGGSTYTNRPTMQSRPLSRRRSLLIRVWAALALSLVLGSTGSNCDIGAINSGRSSGVCGFANAIPITVVNYSALAHHQRILISHSSTTVKHHQPKQRHSSHKGSESKQLDTHSETTLLPTGSLHSHHPKDPRTDHGRFRQQKHQQQPAGLQRRERKRAHRDGDKLERGHKPKLDYYQKEYLDMASRVSGKSRDDVAHISQQYSSKLERESLPSSEDNTAATTVTVNDVEVLQLKTVDNSIDSLKDVKVDDQISSSGSEETHTSIVDYAWVPTHGQRGYSIYDEEGKLLTANVEVGSDGPIGYHKVPKKTTTIFYVPHQDDDALAMALSIREHVESGRRVIVHLYSDGINPLLRDIVAGEKPCTVTHSDHPFNLTLQDEVTGRTHEFRNSLKALGVQDSDILETGWSDAEPFLDYDAFKGKLKKLILRYEVKYPGASHRCISGEYDRDPSGRNPTHRACWDVATDLLDEHPRGFPASKQLWDFLFFRTYTFYKPLDHRSAQYIWSLPKYLRFKQRALDQYKRWDPSVGELAWGYHSVKPLIDASYYDPHLYIDMLDNDPTNPQNWFSVDEGSLQGGRDANVHVEHDIDGARVLMDDDHQSGLSELTASGKGADVEDEMWDKKERAEQELFKKSYEEAIKKPDGRRYERNARRHWSW